MRHLTNQQYRHAYPIRILASTVGTLLLVIALVRLWPVPAPPDYSDLLFSIDGQQVIEIEEIAQTKQAERRPPPPRPLMPIVVPDDEVLEVDDLDISEENFLDIDEPEQAVELVEGDPGPSDAIVAQAETAPKLVRFVYGEYTDEAKKKKVRAEMTVEVLVDRRGRVEEAKVVERIILGRNEDRRSVPHVGYGLEEAALAAAQQWRFRPARQGGQAVRSYTRLTVSFGI